MIQIPSSHCSCFNLRATKLNLPYLTLNKLSVTEVFWHNQTKKALQKPLIFFALHAKRGFLNTVKEAKEHLLSVLKNVYLKTLQKPLVFAQDVSGLLQGPL